MGANGSVYHQSARPEGIDGSRQLDVRRGRVVERADRLILARSTRGFWRLEQRDPTLQSMERQRGLVADI